MTAIYAMKYILNATPLNARTRYALNGISTFVDMFTADNSTALNQAAPTDVRAGVAYGIGDSQTGRLTVPARGSVALSVNYGPSMPFTATRSGTTATATLAYSYPLVVGDEITVTGASNTEWNSTYTIASVVSGTSVTFTVPNTHSASAGAGALMQTTGTAVLDPSSIATAVQNALTAQGLTSARAVNLDNLDATVSSRLAPSGTLATVTTLTNAPTVPTAAEIATAVEGSLLNEADGQAVLNAIVGAIGNTNLSEVSLVAAVRADLERTGGKLDSIPTSSAPSASAVAGAVRTELGVELGRLDASVSSRLAPSGTLATVTTLTNAPTVPSASAIASQVRTELATELARVDQNISSRLASSAYTAPANSDITSIKAKTDNLPASPAATGDIPSANIAAIKSKTDLLNTDRLAQCSTVATTGAQLAAALS